MKLFIKLAALAALAGVAAPVLANPCPPGNPPTNCGPPAGNVIWDLAAQLSPAVPHVFTQYSTSFVATDTSTNLSFAFREDPAFWFLDDVSVTTGGGANLLVNGGLEGLNGWSSLNIFGAAAAGVISGPGGCRSGQCWVDGSVQGYDGLTQVFATTVGATYNISFWLSDDGPLNVASQLSTNGNTTNTGGNGIDVLVYAGGIPTINPNVPEPATLGLLGLAMAGIGFARRKRAA
jgi:hypothetical protein